MFILAHQTARRLAKEAIDKAPDGMVVIIREPNRSLDQNALLHKLIGAIRKAKPIWNGLKMDEEDWKQLLVHSHSIATASGDVRMVPDLEGHSFVQLRESTAKMTKARSTSLIDYTTAWATSHGIQLRDEQ